MIKQQKGLSLVEVLATALVISILLLLAFSIVVSSQKQNIEQTKEVHQINDASYLLKIITKDIRKAKSITVDNQNGKYVLTMHDGDAQLPYEYKNNNIYRNDQVAVNNVENFTMHHVVADTFIKISFTVNGQAYQTSLSYRKGSIQ